MTRDTPGLLPSPAVTGTQSVRRAVIFPLAYIHASTEASHDPGYGLRREFWRRGIVSEAGKAGVEQVKRTACPISQPPMM